MKRTLDIYPIEIDSTEAKNKIIKGKYVDEHAGRIIAECQYFVVCTDNYEMYRVYHHDDDVERKLFNDIPLNTPITLELKKYKRDMGKWAITGWRVEDALESNTI
jgi:hypothetical protein